MTFYETKNEILKNMGTFQSFAPSFGNTVKIIRAMLERIENKIEDKPQWELTDEEVCDASCLIRIINEGACSILLLDKDKELLKMLVNVYQNLQEDYNNSDIDESVKELIQTLTPIEEMNISELLCYCEQAQRRVDSIFEAERFYNENVHLSGKYEAEIKEALSRRKEIEKVVTE